MLPGYHDEGTLEVVSFSGPGSRMRQGTAEVEGYGYGILDAGSVNVSAVGLRESSITLSDARAGSITAVRPNPNPNPNPIPDPNPKPNPHPHPKPN